MSLDHTLLVAMVLVSSWMTGVCLFVISVSDFRLYLIGGDGSSEFLDDWGAFVCHQCK